jgi:hypothetical protein
LVVAARHAEVAEDELREERQVKSNKNDESGEPGPAFRIQLAGNFRPPEMHAAQISHQRAADHDVVKVRDHKISVVDVNVDT